MLTKTKYYDLMCSDMKKDKSFESLHTNWFKCFRYILKGFKKKNVKSLFYDFEMLNWTALHLENTEYKEHTKEQLIDKFLGECQYISDRASYDRLFRTHWFFLRAFKDELNKVRFPNLFKD